MSFGKVEDLPRNDDGTLPHYAWPGGYQILYTLQDETITLCPDCANKQENTPDAWLIHWEGPPDDCDECGKIFPSIYGDPETQCNKCDFFSNIKPICSSCGGRGRQRSTYGDWDVACDQCFGVGKIGIGSCFFMLHEYDIRGPSIIQDERFAEECKFFRTDEDESCPCTTPKDYGMHEDDIPPCCCPGGSKCDKEE